MARWLSFLAQVAAFASLAWAKSSTGDSVLVVLEKDLQREQFSTFFNGLEERGYQLTFREPKAKSPVVLDAGVPQFSHIVLFSPTTKSYAEDISPQSLVSLLAANVNIIFTLSPTQTILSSLASEFSLIIPPPHTPLLSHFPPRDTPPTILPISIPSSAPFLTPGTPPILFSGIPHALSTNPLLVPFVHAPPESFAAESESDGGADAIVDAAEKGGEGLWAGSSMGVVTGFQAKDGGRAMWVGGVDVFSDDFAQQEVEKGVTSGNAQFSQDIAAWTFQETGVLRIDNTTHHKVGEVSAPEMYTVNDKIVYTTHISKYNSTTSKWAPFSGLTDLQLEFTMLDPHIRTALKPLAGSPGTYQLTFRAPDRHGVFKFVIDYKRKGWSHLSSAITVPVVPPRHDGYPRFLSAAWPYYAGAMSTSAGFVLFSALWLAGDVRDGKKAKGKAKAE